MAIMREVTLIFAAASTLAALVAGFLGFVYYPARAKRAAGHERAVRRRGGKRGRGRHRHDSELPPNQGMARALFIVFAAMAFLCGFLWLTI